jgi:hypothetical protein
MNRISFIIERRPQIRQAEFARGYAMSLHRILFVTAVLAAVPFGAAQAQFGAAQGQKPPCFDDFMPLRAAVEKAGNLINAAGKKKVSPSEACRLFRNFSAAEAKMLKFVEKNGQWCGFPAEAATQLKTSHAKTVVAANRVCTQASAAPAPPPGPSLSDAIGTTRLPSSENAKTGRGTYDTLTGNPLVR